MRSAKNVIPTISKGYRLKPSTHNMIKKVKAISNNTQDKVIRAAMKLYSTHLNSEIKNVPKGEAL